MVFMDGIILLYSMRRAFSDTDLSQACFNPRLLLAHCR